jgi:hypothetical protein
MAQGQPVLADEIAHSKLVPDITGLFPRDVSTPRYHLISVFPHGLLSAWAK